MTDPHDPIGVAKSRGWFSWLGGRASRREYWLYVGLLIVLGLLLSHAPPIMSVIFSVVLALVQARRLHDLGRSGWWALILMAAPVLIGLSFYPVAGEEVAVAASTLALLTFMALLGALPGSRGENRFGPPPPFTVRRVLTGR